MAQLQPKERYCATLSRRVSTGGDAAQRKRNDFFRSRRTVWIDPESWQTGCPRLYREGTIRVKFKDIIP